MTVADIETGEAPVINISNARDAYDNPIEGEHTVVIAIDEGSETVDIEFTEGDAQFTWSVMEEADEYTATVTLEEIERSDVFTVETDIQPAEFQLSDLRVEPKEAEVGEDIQLMIDVTNIGEETGNHTIEFYIDGEYVGNEIVLSMEDRR